MKKYFLTAAALLLFSPLTASADLVATGNMQVVANTTTNAPIQKVDFDGSGSQPTKTYYADYNAIYFGTMTMKPGYTSLTFDSGEVFCVENSDLISSSTPYAFYTSDTLWSGETLNQVTWIANWATSNNSVDIDGITYTGDAIKAIGQVAIWDIVISSAIFTDPVAPAIGYYAPSQKLISEFYYSAENQGAFVNDWLLAVNPVEGTPSTVQPGQNFLVKATATPVPEPGTMLLFGTGLAGLAAVSRRRRN